MMTTSLERKINSLYIRDYSRAKDTVMDAMKPYLKLSQAQAGFKVKTTEKILELLCDLSPTDS